MSKIFEKPSSIKLPRRKGEDKREQYGKEHKGIEKCPVCGNVKVKKRWYKSLRLARTKMKNPPLRIKADKKEVCPACNMIRNHVFEGEMRIAEFPRNKRKDLLSLIKNFGKIALSKDPQDRIIKIENLKDGLRLTTTENQMIGRLAKRIKESFKCIESKVTHSKEPFEVDRAHITYIEKK